MSRAPDSHEGAGPGFGLPPALLAALRAVFDATPGLRAVWVHGSRARGTAHDASDIDLALDAPGLDAGGYSRLLTALEAAPTLLRIDAVRWQDVEAGPFHDEIRACRRLLWAPQQAAVQAPAAGSVQLKDFQQQVLQQLQAWLAALREEQADSAQRLATPGLLQAMEGEPEALAALKDFPKKAWQRLKAAGALPKAFHQQAHSSRFDGAGRPIPNACLKIPTGGGKTLLAAASVAQVHTAYLRRHTGLVLWVVPNEAIYRQTLKALGDRDHPYRQMLNVAGAGRVKILEKHSPLSRLDTDSHLCVMLLMLQSAARQSKEQLRLFRDRGNVLGFLPREDDLDAHWALLQQVPNLDVYKPWGASDEEVRAQKGSVIKSSLGNVMRLLRPMVVIDEGHHAYSDTALRTLDGFNPSLLLELSATPRVASAKGPGSNILVDVRGTDLEAAEMIKLPIQVDVRAWNDWQSCLGAAVQQLDDLQRQAERLHGATGRYLRPILLVQVERTGADLLEAGYIHAEHAKAHLLQLGFTERQIAIKTSEKDELSQPENLDLLSPANEVRAIITKQALQEGWDCPFAYVLCALAAGRNPAALTQLVGRILRQPQTAKTGIPELDACYVLCHDARTADVVSGIKRSLETEGMGDLTVQVRSGEGGSDTTVQTVRQTRRAAFKHMRLFLPRVTWADGDERRELVYDSDVLARLPWDRINPARLAEQWAPHETVVAQQHLRIGLDILRPGSMPQADTATAADARLDRGQLVRALLDLAPNPWLVWTWVDAVVARLLRAGHAESALAASRSSLVERLRVDLERQRDDLAQQVFEALVGAGHIQFRLRADHTDFELPQQHELQLPLPVQPLVRRDGRPVDKSLLEPAVRTPADNQLEIDFACYLDGRAALQWWHRNVAKTQYGLQGWKRSKVYPDFVFAYAPQAGGPRIVVMETKGLHLAGSQDTAYKQALLQRLSQAFADERFKGIGQLELAGEDQDVVCDLVIDEAWEGEVEKRYFRSPIA